MTDEQRRDSVWHGNLRLRLAAHCPELVPTAETPTAWGNAVGELVARQAAALGYLARMDLDPVDRAREARAALFGEAE